MRKLKSIHQYSDPGHSWFKVSKSMLHDLGIADKISQYSYQRGDHAYLEEDCDFGIFLKAIFNGVIPDHWWNQIKIVKHHSERRQSVVRSYHRYSPEIAPELAAGLRFKLYGNVYIAVAPIERAWIVESVTGARFKLKQSQFGDIKTLESEVES